MPPKLACKPNPRRGPALILHYRQARETPHPYIDYHMEESDVGKWFIRIRDLAGNKDEFKGGEYIVEMRAQDSYPMTAPKFFMHTPNGVYEPSKEVCLGTGHDHTENYAAASQKMQGFAREIMNGMLAWDELISGRYIMNTTVAEKSRLAALSVDFNRKHYADLIDKFNAQPFNVMRRLIRVLGFCDQSQKVIRHYLGLD